MKEPLGDIWVLTIPGFHWTKANTTASPRFGHKCASVGGRQMISVGGLGEVQFNPETASQDPWPQGVGVLDMKTLSWQPGYESNGAAYEAPDAIKTWYDDG